MAAELDGIFCALWGRQTTTSRFTKFGQIRGWGTIYVVSFAPFPCLLPSNLHGQRSQDIWSLLYFCFPLFTDGDRLSWFSDKALATSSCYERATLSFFLETQSECQNVLSGPASPPAWLMDINGRLMGKHHHGSCELLSCSAGL